MKRRTPYVPIADYALIGNRHTCALVARDGSIDWCCLPHLDSPSVFGAMLDARRAGSWRVGPAGESTVRRSYLGASSILETVFEGSGGSLQLLDFLPIRRGRGDEASRSAHAVVRIATCTAGEVEVDVTWKPRPNYARDDVGVVLQGEVIHARTRRQNFWLSGLPLGPAFSVEGAVARSRVTLRAGERLRMISGLGEAPLPPGSADGYLSETLDWWEAWGERCCLPPGGDGLADLVLRSGMVLRLLTNEASGAIAAAPTTSLPEEIGGVRNWDYRFCWVRDAALISGALVRLGQPDAGVAFLRFLESASRQHHDPARVQVLYRLDGRTSVSEYDLGHLDGYRDSRPVRIGNAAAIQRQLDVYGELLEAAHDLLQIGASITPTQWNWLQGVADYVCNVWGLKDRGIWEVRGPEMHFTYSKLMCWVALDRALKLAQRFPAGERRVRTWRREREALRSAILERGYDRELGSFVQSFESRTLDASNLLIPLTGFLPASDPRVQGTIDATLRHLTDQGMVYRYRTEDTHDGVSGGEGAFGICTFWLVDALALSNRTVEAREIFDAMVARANDVGLFPEEIDPATGEFLGNFPQAFTHVGLVNSAHILGSIESGSRNSAAASELLFPGWAGR
jgi:GH15 family glucan-1,4-alpha-glucosidase